MSEPNCALCGKPITEQDDADNNYCETANGEYHVDCFNEWEDDADGRAADYYYDTSIDS